MMRLSFLGSTGWLASTYSSRFPLPLVSMISGVLPSDNRLVAGGLAIPNLLVAPIRRVPMWIVQRGRRLGIAEGMLDLPRLIGHRIQHRDHVGALLGRPVDPALGVDARITLIG